MKKKGEKNNRNKQMAITIISFTNHLNDETKEAKNPKKR